MGRKHDEVEEPDWDRYASEIAELGANWPGGPDFLELTEDEDEDWPEPVVHTRVTGAGPRDWRPAPDLSDPAAEAADILDATYSAQPKRHMTGLEKVLLAVFFIGLALIIASEIDLISISLSLFTVIVVAVGASAVAWVVAFATGRRDDDDGIRL
ncbi:MAG: hypothetical protein Q4P33_07970 [Flaviflexus sp.]|nr:hypothetical protein [Flaviflexus sp.]